MSNGHFYLEYKGNVLEDIGKLDSFMDEMAIDYTSSLSGPDVYEEKIGFIIDLSKSNYPEVIPIAGKLTKKGNKFKGSITNLRDGFKRKDFPYIDPEVNNLIQKTEQLHFFRTHNYNNHSDETKDYIPFIREYLKLFNQLIQDLKGQILMVSYVHDQWWKINARDLYPIDIGNDSIQSKFIIEEEKDVIKTRVDYFFSSANKQFKLKNQENYFLLKANDNTYLPWHSVNDFLLAWEFFFKQNTISIFSQKSLDNGFDHLLNKMNNKFDLTMPNLNKKIKETPVAKIYLSESNPFLIITPIVAYGDYEFTISGKITSNVVRKEGTFYQIDRDTTFENEILSFIAGLHEKFNVKTYLEYFYLHQKDVLKNYWFIYFYEQCTDRNIEIFGIKELNSIKYTPYRPVISYSFKSDIQWFDIGVNIKYGEQNVKLKDLQKAFLNKQDYVKLNDGSLGILPIEWLKKFSSALSLGKLDGDSLKLPKTHFLLVEQLYREFEAESIEIARELKEKKKLLQSYEKIDSIKVPKGISADLRDYQKGGVNWFNFLAKFKWGGCLADDMGLGKTLQLLTFFVHLKENKPKANYKFLVVCPTTLLFNWQNEIDKFCKDLSYNLHWGNNRPDNVEKWKEADVILTSYGTLVNDIELFRQYIFKAAVLDESQAIKNPGSLRYKACCVLKADHRFTLTGTPIENNTTELFSQMNFINPGLLGTLNAFRNNFASPIEKDKDQTRINQLRSIIKPFILRRSKEQVALELPEKTEMILYCEMEKEQREVYEVFRQNYKEALMNKIAEEGLDQARFNVLDGILKLRQICDSPSLIKSKEKYTNQSVKIDELVRHIIEKTGNHKILVFSQFVKMMNLVQEKLDHHKISYAYLDGSTRKREQEVNKFQENEGFRVFLISLKAGGVGLNLTAADYVFLVDPWWNPAVEKQAIDRTHRIGQEKHVFAYRMICKDTIEEKILTLQQKKKDLSDDLITSEKGLMKHLTKEDIEYLFS